MATATATEPKVKMLMDSSLKEKLQQLRLTDNTTNLYYLVRTYVFLVLVIVGTIAFYEYREAAGWSWWWNVPITLLAIIAIGAGQHQLSGLGHEAAHHTLLRHRFLNDLVSDWFCMFPLFSSTHHYRLQHLAHHQFVNDPVRDPDIFQLKASGHWLDFPMERGRFLWVLVKQLWVPNLVKYIRERARYSALPSQQNPYASQKHRPSKVAVRVGLFYLVSLAGLLTALVHHGDPGLLAIVPTAYWAAIEVFYFLIPGRLYHHSRLHPVISARIMTMGRITFLTAIFTGLAWATLLTGRWAAVYFLVLWIVPICTALSFFMILRQLVQHGNGGRGWLTNTRIFFVHRLIKACLFPIGQDFHLPHHLFSTVPHYRLAELHELLLAYPEYQNEAVIVEGYFRPAHQPPVHPTVLDVIGPDYAPADRGIYIDDSVLDMEQVEEKAEILKQGETAVATASTNS